jgi:hypothetical protein
MRPIPKPLRNLLDRMPRMHLCEAKWLGFGDCNGRIEWHHVWTYGADGQINEHWSILGACSHHHEMVKQKKAVKELFERRSLEIATDAELQKYPRKDWKQLKKYLKVNCG